MHKCCITQHITPESFTPTHASAESFKLQYCAVPPEFEQSRFMCILNLASSPWLWGNFGCFSVYCGSVKRIVRDIGALVWCGLYTESGLLCSDIIRSQTAALLIDHKTKRTCMQQSIRILIHIRPIGWEDIHAHPFLCAWLRCRLYMCVCVCCVCAQLLLIIGDY